MIDLVRGLAVFELAELLDISSALGFLQSLDINLHTIIVLNRMNFEYNSLVYFELSELVDYGFMS